MQRPVGIVAIMYFSRELAGDTAPCLKPCLSRERVERVANRIRSWIRSRRWCLMFPSRDPDGNYIQVYHLYPQVRDMQQRAPTTDAF